MPTVILHASIRHGGKLQALADDQRLLTDEELDVLEIGDIKGNHLQDLVRGCSVA
ncbi:hypothetical protein [Streptomyces sp. NPDC057253]|uniref:hypothetical protein n=1 Tax=Streptomyces sp. NPDC057253 TaxID=3346069 RepID=UPI00363761B1